MRGIRQSLEHQPEGNVAQKRRNLGCRMGISFRGNDVATCPLGQFGYIIVHENNGYLCRAETLKYFRRHTLACLGRKRTEEYTDYTLFKAKLGAKFDGARNCRVRTKIGDK